LKKKSGFKRFKRCDKGFPSERLGGSVSLERIRPAKESTQSKSFARRKEKKRKREDERKKDGEEERSLQP